MEQLRLRELQQPQNRGQHTLPHAGLALLGCLNTHPRTAAPIPTATPRRGAGKRRALQQTVTACHAEVSSEPPKRGARLLLGESWEPKGGHHASTTLWFGLPANRLTPTTAFSLPNGNFQLVTLLQKGEDKHWFPLLRPTRTLQDTSKSRAGALCLPPAPAPAPHVLQTPRATDCPFSPTLGSRGSAHLKRDAAVSCEQPFPRNKDFYIKSEISQAGLSSNPRTKLPGEQQTLLHPAPSQATSRGRRPGEVRAEGAPQPLRAEHPSRHVARLVRNVPSSQ